MTASTRQEALQLGGSGHYGFRTEMLFKYLPSNFQCALQQVA